MANSKTSVVAYGGKKFGKIRPRHLLNVAANETRMLFSKTIIKRVSISKDHFLLWDVPTDYFLHKYNTTWRNERAVELAAADAFIKSRPLGSLLEFGNVLGNYRLGNPDVVVDLYEKGPGITNLDIVDFISAKKFDSIISISTIEHVGWDEHPQSPTKTKEALERLTQLLNTDGRLFITAPTGHNPFLDELIEAGVPNLIRETFFTRDRFKWTSQSEYVALPYGSRGPGAASFWLAEIGSAQ